MDKREAASQRHLLTFKLGYLEDQQKELHAVVDEHVNKVLQMGKAWLEESGGSVYERATAYREISHLIEDTTLFVTRKCGEMSGDDQACSVATPTACALTTSTPLEASSHQASGDSGSHKQIMSRLTVLEETVATLNTNVNTSSEKQTYTEQGLKDLILKLNKIDQEQIKLCQEMKASAKELQDEQSRVEMEYRAKLKDLDHQLQELGKLQTRSQPVLKMDEMKIHGDKTEKLETRLQELEKRLGSLKQDGLKLSSHVDYLEVSLNYDKEIEGIKQRIEKLETISQKVKKVESIGKKVEKLEMMGQELEATGEKIERLEGLETRIGKLEAAGQKRSKKTDTLGKKVEQLEYLEHRIAKLEAAGQKIEEIDTLDKKIGKLQDTTDSLSVKIDDQSSSLQELATCTNSNTRALENNSACHEKDHQQLQDVQERLRLVEKKEHKAVRELGAKFGDVELKYQMVCQIVADRLAPLEQLRDIFNKNLKRRSENQEKLNDVVKQVAMLVPKVSELEARNQRVGVSVYRSNLSPIQGNVVDCYKVAQFDVADHFDCSAGKFNVPLDGLYGLFFNMWQTGVGNAELIVYRTRSGKQHDAKTDETICWAYTERNKSGDNYFQVLDLKAGESVYSYISSARNSVNLMLDLSLSIFLIA